MNLSSFLGENPFMEQSKKVIIFTLSIALTLCAASSARAQDSISSFAMENPLAPVKQADEIPKARTLPELKAENPESGHFKENTLHYGEGIPTDIQKMGVVTMAQSLQAEVTSIVHEVDEEGLKSKFLTSSQILDTLQDEEASEAEGFESAQVKKRHILQRMELMDEQKKQVKELKLRHKEETAALIEELKTERAENPAKIESGHDPLADLKHSKDEAADETMRIKAAKQEQMALLRDEARAIARKFAENVGILRESYLVQWKDALKDRREIVSTTKEQRAVEIEAGKKLGLLAKGAALKAANDSYNQTLTEIRNDFRKAALQFRNEYAMATDDMRSKSQARIITLREEIRKQRRDTHKERA